MEADFEQQEEVDAGPGSQHQPLEISSDSETDGDGTDGDGTDGDGTDSEPRRSGRVKRVTRTIESQQWQIDHGLIPAPDARGRARALNAKKKKNIETSQLQDEFELAD